VPALNENRRPIEEAVGVALSRGNMRQREGACDLDKIAALGMVGIEERLADAVFRLKYANDHKSYDEALVGVYGLSRALNARLRWRSQRGRLRWMSVRVLRYWMADVCPICTGVKYETVNNTPHLSARTCPECGGSGKRAMPWIKRLPRMPEGRRATRARIERWKRVCRMLSDSMDRHRRLLVELEAMERQVGEKMVRKLASRI
jgi:hypothetical protein